MCSIPASWKITNHITSMKNSSKLPQTRPDFCHSNRLPCQLLHCSGKGCFLYGCHDLQRRRETGLDNSRKPDIPGKLHNLDKNRREITCLISESVSFQYLTLCSAIDIRGAALKAEFFLFLLLRFHENGITVNATSK